MNNQVLTDEQEEKLIIALGKGQKEFSEDDAQIVLVWAQKAAVDMALFEMVMTGELVLSIKYGKIHFQKPANLSRISKT